MVTWFGRGGPEVLCTAAPRLRQRVSDRLLYGAAAHRLTKVDAGQQLAQHLPIAVGHETPTDR
jgi:hypothetical protein